MEVGNNMKLAFEGKIERDEIIERAYVDAGQQFDEKLLNSLVFGDNLDGLNYMIANGYAGRVDLIYIDPPFATNSEFKDASNGGSSISMLNDAELAYSDTRTEDEFLAFLWPRFILLRELLSDKGSMYVHIDVKYAPYFKVMLDEIFGRNNYVNEISRVKSNPKNFSRKAYGNEHDTVLFYAKNAGENIWNEVKLPLSKQEIKDRFTKKDRKGYYTTVPVHAPGETMTGQTGGEWKGMLPPVGRHWRTNPSELDKMDAAGLIEWSSTGNPRIKKYAKEHSGKKMQDVWLDFKDPQKALYPTQKNGDMLDMIVRQSSEQGSLVLDAFAGSGETLRAAAENGRNFIGMDMSAVSKKVITDRLSENDNFHVIELNK